jgi:hypothetical protein
LRLLTADRCASPELSPPPQQWSETISLPHLSFFVPPQNPASLLARDPSPDEGEPLDKTVEQATHIWRLLGSRALSGEALGWFSLFSKALSSLLALRGDDLFEPQTARALISTLLGEGRREYEQLLGEIPEDSDQELALDRQRYCESVQQQLDRSARLAATLGLTQAVSRGCEVSGSRMPAFPVFFLNSLGNRRRV